MTELISIILNALLGSGLVATMVFYRPKRRCDTRGCANRIPPSEY